MAIRFTSPTRRVRSYFRCRRAYRCRDRFLSLSVGEEPCPRMSTGSSVASPAVHIIRFDALRLFRRHWGFRRAGTGEWSHLQKGRESSRLRARTTTPGRSSGMERVVLYSTARLQQTQFLPTYDCAGRNCECRHTKTTYSVSVSSMAMGVTLTEISSPSGLSVSPGSAGRTVSTGSGRPVLGPLCMSG